MQLPLPTADSGLEPLEQSAPRLTVNVLTDGTLLLSGHKIRADQLQQRLTARLKDSGPGLQVRIRSDRGVPYRFVEPIMLACAARDLGRVLCRVSVGGCSLMRRPSVFTAHRGELDVKMTPMIDVVFLLLVFFVWTASFQIVEQILPSNLTAVSGNERAAPDDPPPPEEDFDKVVIRVTWDGQQPLWRVNEQRVTNLAQVRNRLEAIANIKRDAPVILHPDGDVPLGDVIDIYDLTRLVGFEKIQFAASEKL